MRKITEKQTTYDNIGRKSDKKRHRSTLPQSNLDFRWLTPSVRDLPMALCRWHPTDAYRPEADRLLTAKVVTTTKAEKSQRDRKFLLDFLRCVYIQWVAVWPLCEYNV
jgi:hypothetical protein